MCFVLIIKQFHLQFITNETCRIGQQLQNCVPNVSFNNDPIENAARAYRLKKCCRRSSRSPSTAGEKRGTNLALLLT